MKLRIAVIGCGGICQEYALHIRNYPDILQIVGATDLDRTRAEAFCLEHGGKVYEGFEDVLADPEVDVILNLTVHRAHYDLNTRALEAGKHVYSEKPMALTYEEGVKLIALAQKVGRRMAAAPITFLGEGVQTAAKILEESLIGPVRLVYAEVNWGQINRWIPAPKGYFTVGPLLDVGVYAITALTFLLGPVRSVWGYSAILQNPRRGSNGEEFPVTAPDFTTGMMEFENGIVARITTNYYVPKGYQTHLQGFEFHGDEGAIVVSDYHNFNAVCQWFPYCEKPIDIPLLRENAPMMDRAIGLVDLASAIEEGRPHRSSAEQAAHVIEIMEGLQKSAELGTKVAIQSNFERPPLMDWARDAKFNVPKKS